MWASSWASTASSWSGVRPVRAQAGSRITGRSQPRAVGTSTAADCSRRTVRVRRSSRQRRESTRCHWAGTGPAWRRRRRWSHTQPPRKRRDRIATPRAQPVSSQGRAPPRRLWARRARGGGPAAAPSTTSCRDPGVVAAAGTARRCRKVKTGAATITSRAVQATAYRTFALASRSRTSRPQARPPTKAPCQRKWSRDHPRAWAQGSRTSGSRRFTVFPLRPGR